MRTVWPCTQFCGINQCLPRGRTGGWHRGGLLVSDRRRLACNFIFLRDRELPIAAFFAQGEEGVDRIAGLQRGNFAPCFFDYAGRIHSRNQRQSGVEIFGIFPRANRDIDGINRRRHDANQDLVIFWLWSRRLFVV